MRLGPELQAVQGVVDGGELETDAQAKKTLPLLDVRAKPVLLVLGEHGEKAGIELVVGARSLDLAAADLRQVADLTQELIDVVERIGAQALLDREDAAVDVDAAEQEIDDVLGQL